MIDAYAINGSCIVFAESPEQALTCEAAQDQFDSEDDPEVRKIEGNKYLTFDFTSIGGEGVVSQKAYVWIDFHYRIKPPYLFSVSDW